MSEFTCAFLLSNVGGNCFLTFTGFQGHIDLSFHVCFNTKLSRLLHRLRSRLLDPCEVNVSTSSTVYLGIQVMRHIIFKAKTMHPKFYYSHISSQLHFQKSFPFFSHMRHGYISHVCNRKFNTLNFNPTRRLYD